MAADCGCGGTCPACKLIVDAYRDYHHDIIMGGETIEKDLKPVEVLNRHIEKLEKQKKEAKKNKN